MACTGVHGANRLASNSLLESLVFAWRAAHLLVEEGPQAVRRWPVLSVENGIRLELEDDALSAPELLPSRGALQQLMWQSAGIVRCATDLRAAQTLLRGWHFNPGNMHDRETANLLLLARTVVAAALQREESRGAHARADLPLPEEAQRHHIAITRQVHVPC